MWQQLIELLICPKDSIIFGSQNGIFHPNNWVVIQPMLQPIMMTAGNAFNNAGIFVRKVVCRCRKH